MRAQRAAKAESLFTYDWKIEGQWAKFSVETQLFDSAPDASLPFLFCIRAAAPDGKTLDRGLEARLSRVKARCDKLLPCYAGSIRAEVQTQIYYYGENPETLDELEKLTFAERKLDLAAACRREPEWETYLDLLYPNAAKYQTELNRQTIETYAKNGDAPEKPRRVTLHVFFPAEPMMLQFTEAARLAGFAVGNAEYAPESELSYGVSLYRITTLEKCKVDALTTKAIRIAEKYDGRLVHWNCQLVPKKRPL